MPELETKLRGAAPRATHAPAHLEAAIWSTLSRDTIEVIDPGWRPPHAPELVIDDEPQVRRPSRFGLALGMVAAAAVLVGAVVLAGLRDSASSPAGGTPTTSTSTSTSTPAPAPATAAPGHFYVEGTCPDPARGACFDPFPAGRYSFHKANPQVTLTVPAGWHNDQAWPDLTVLSRADTPGATLEILNDAHAVQVHGCTVTPKGGSHTASHLTTTVLVHHDGLRSSAPAVARLGERLGYQVDVSAPADLKGVDCGADFAGAVLFTDDARPDQAGWLIALRPGESARIVLADGSNGRTLALLAHVTGGQRELQAWLRKAQPVIDSITFAPCTHAHISFQACEDLPTTSP